MWTVNYKTNKKGKNLHREADGTYQKCFIEFKGSRELFKELMQTIQPLDENGRSAIEIILVGVVPTSGRKLMTKI